MKFVLISLAVMPLMAGAAFEFLATPGIAVQELKWRSSVGPRPIKLILPLGEGSDRYIVRFPKLPDESYYGACGSFHYNPDTSDWIDAYAHPRTACTLLQLMQDWRANHCASSEFGCRIQWGDISHKKEKYFSGHQTHTHGFCIDMRPFRQGAFSNTPLWYTDPRYDRAVTRKFLSLIKRKYAASAVYFNDPVLIREGLATRKGGHDNHIHFCLRNLEAMKKTCQGFKLDPGVCPFFHTDEME